MAMNDCSACSGRSSRAHAAVGRKPVRGHQDTAPLNEHPAVSPVSILGGAGAAAEVCAGGCRKGHPARHAAAVQIATRGRKRVRSGVAARTVNMHSGTPELQFRRRRSSPNQCRLPVPKGRRRELLPKLALRRKVRVERFPKSPARSYILRHPLRSTPGTDTDRERRYEPAVATGRPPLATGPHWTSFPVGIFEARGESVFFEHRSVERQEMSCTGLGYALFCGRPWAGGRLSSGPPMDRRRVRRDRPHGGARDPDRYISSAGAAYMFGIGLGGGSASRIVPALMLVGLCVGSCGMFRMGRLPPNAR